MPSLQDAALELRKAEEIFDIAWDAYWQTVPRLKPSKFWKLLDEFLVEVVQFRLEYKRTNGIEQAAEEFFRKATFVDSITTPFNVLAFAKTYQWSTTTTFNDALAFAKTYQWVVVQIEKKIGKLFEFNGDSFGDLTDSLPLLGQEILSEHFSKQSELQAFIKAQAKIKAEKVYANNANKTTLETCKSLVNLIGGENYIRMSLQDAAKKYYLASLKTAG